MQLAGGKIPIVIGFLVMLFGALVMWSGWGGASSAGAGTPGELRDQEQTVGWMLLVGGLFLFFTGFWFLTRNCVGPRTIAGLFVMLSGIFVGTWGGTASVAGSNGRDSMGATLVFLGGLLIHLLGVLYVKNE
jgi:hypothetical protein